MRDGALEAIETLAERDERIVFLTGDLGFMVVESLFARFPERTFNVGVAEQNMVAMATGMAEAGLIPFVYSIAPFATLRPFEFIRNGPVLQELPVRIIGVGSGLEYGINGPTHFGLEDVGVLRTQPGLSIFAPADRLQTVACIEATWDRPGPVYYRLSKERVAPLDALGSTWGEDGVDVLARGGDEIAVLASGALAGQLDAVRGELGSRGVEVTTAVVSRLAPTPVAPLAALAASHRAVVTLESHYLTGGLGSMMCEVVAEAGMACRVVRCGVERAPRVVGSSGFLASAAGLDRDAVVKTVEEVSAVLRSPSGP